MEAVRISGMGKEYYTGRGIQKYNEDATTTSDRSFKKCNKEFDEMLKRVYHKTYSNGKIYGKLRLQKYEYSDFRSRFNYVINWKRLMQRTARNQRV